MPPKAEGLYGTNHMNLISLTAADLKELVGLLEQREDLQAQVAKIDAALAVYEAGKPARPATGTDGRRSAPKPNTEAQPKPRQGKRAARGSVKTAIIDLIKGAGKSGITVKEIAAELGANYNRVFTWFYNTGKTIKEIKKTGPGKYAWTEGGARRIKPSPEPEPTPKPKPKPTVTKPAVKQAAPAKPKGEKPGVSKDRIIELLKRAGKDGIAVKDVAGKLNAKLVNVRVWFATTAKRVNQIKKVAPAKYAWVG